MAVAMLGFGNARDNGTVYDKDRSGLMEKWSPNKKYVALFDFAKQGKTTVFKVRPDGKRAEQWEWIWTRYGYSHEACLSDDGQYLAIPYQHYRPDRSGYDPEENMLTILNRGKIAVTVKFSKLADIFSKLAPETFERSWGHAKGFSEKNEFMVDTYSGEIGRAHV